MSFFSCSGGSPPTDHWGGMPEFVAKNKKSFHKFKVLLTKQPPPKGKLPDFQPFVMLHFRKRNLANNLAAVAEKLNTYVDVDTKFITLDTDEAR